MKLSYKVELSKVDCRSVRNIKIWTRVSIPFRMLHETNLISFRRVDISWNDPISTHISIKTPDLTSLLLLQIFYSMKNATYDKVAFINPLVGKENRFEMKTLLSLSLVQPLA